MLGEFFQRWKRYFLGYFVSASGANLWGVFSAPQAKIFGMYSYRRRRKFLGYFVSASGANLWGVFSAPWEKYIGVNFQRIFILVFFQREVKIFEVYYRGRKKKWCERRRRKIWGCFFSTQGQNVLGYFAPQAKILCVFSEILYFSIFSAREVKICEVYYRGQKKMVRFSAPEAKILRCLVLKF